MNLGARLMTAEPGSVAEALRWADQILAEVPHGKTRWQIEQELTRVRDLLAWLKCALAAVEPPEEQA